MSGASCPLVVWCRWTPFDRICIYSYASFAPPLLSLQSARTISWLESPPSPPCNSEACDFSAFPFRLYLGPYWACELPSIRHSGIATVAFPSPFYTLRPYSDLLPFSFAHFLLPTDVGATKRNCALLSPLVDDHFTPRNTKRRQCKAMQSSTTVVPE